MGRNGCCSNEPSKAEGEWNLEMLILSRRESERVHLGDDIVLTIVRVNGDKVRIGVEAPPHIKILRTELEVSPKVGEPARDQSEIRRAA
jgi:carbon storage regulator